MLNKVKCDFQELIHTCNYSNLMMLTLRLLF